jgi:hypothetical protein
MAKPKRSPVSAVSSISVHDRSWFNIPMSADYCGVTSFWVEEATRAGKLPYRWAGRRIMLRSDLDSLMLALPVHTGMCDMPAFMVATNAAKMPQGTKP